MKASKALTVSMSVFRGRIPWHFSLSEINISPAAPDLELILFPLWYWPIMNAHTEQQQDKVFEMDFIDSQKSDPPFVHLLALSHICIWVASILSVHITIMQIYIHDIIYAHNTDPKFETSWIGPHWEN